MVTGPRAAAHTVVQADYTERQAILLVRTHKPIDDPMWTVRPVSLEELALAYMSMPAAATPARQEVAA
jgi:ABC-2 type transport system ATP-binding protein